MRFKVLSVWVAALALVSAGLAHASGVDEHKEPVRPTDNSLDVRMDGVGARKAVWMKDFGAPWWNDDLRLAILLNRGLNEVFLSLQATWINANDPDHLGHESYTDKLAIFIGKAHARRIKISAMTLESPNYILDDIENTGAERRIRGILAYNSAHPGATLDGIHIDTEPHTLPDWLTNKSFRMGQFLTMLSQIRSVLAAEGSSIEFSAAIAWFYNEQAGLGQHSGSAANLATYLDVLVPMVYDGCRSLPDAPCPLGDTKADILSKAGDEVRAVLPPPRVGWVPTIIGIGANDLGTIAEIATTTAYLESELASYPNYLGTSIWKYDHMLGAMKASRQADDSIDVRYDVSWCTAATGYHILYGDLDNVRNLATNTLSAIGGAACAIGTSGFYTWRPNEPTGRDLWFVVVADDGVSTEGSWGTGTNGERGGATPSGRCSMTTRAPLTEAPWGICP
jgi:hypothetical protein